MPKQCLSVVCVLANAGENGSRVPLHCHHRYVVPILQHTRFHKCVLATLCMQAVEFSAFDCFFFLILETEERNSEAVCQCSEVQNGHT